MALGDTGGSWRYRIHNSTPLKWRMVFKVLKVLMVYEVFHLLYIRGQYPMEYH